MAKRGHKPREYALYKGDDFIELGFIKDIAEKTGLNVDYLYSMTGNRKTGSYSLDLIEED